MRIGLNSIPRLMRGRKQRGKLHTNLAYWSTAAEKAVSLGLGINAGHDLNLENLPRMRNLPGLLEVSIGHHLMAHALYVGLEQSVKDYRAALGQDVA